MGTPSLRHAGSGIGHPCFWSHSPYIWKRSQSSGAGEKLGDWVREKQDDVISKHRQLDNLVVDLDTVKEMSILQMPGQGYNCYVEEQG